MNKDLIIGIVVSLALHATFLGAFNRKEAPAAKVEKKEEAVVQFEMPPLDEEKPDEPCRAQDRAQAPAIRLVSGCGRA